MPRKTRRPTEAVGYVDAPLSPDEFDRLRKENDRLRLAAHGPPNLVDTAAAARRLVADLPPGEAPDQVVDALTQVMVMRESLLVVIADFQLALGHLERQLITMAPATELKHGGPGGCRLVPVSPCLVDLHEIEDRRHEAPLSS